MTYLEQLRDERKQRFARMARQAVPDTSIEMLSASQRSSAFTRPPVLEDRPVDPWELDKMAFAAWLKRQEEIHPLDVPPPKDTWFAIEAEGDIPQPRVEDIQKTVARRYRITRRDLLSHRRLADLVLPRQIAMYLAKTLTLKSLPDIGRRFAYRDHTTVLHAVRKIDAMLLTHPMVAGNVAALKDELLSHASKRSGAFAEQAVEGSSP